MSVVLFDLDGTLIDSSADLALAVNLTRQDFDLPLISLEEVLACVGEGVRVLIQRAIPERPDLWEEMLARQRQNYIAHCLDNTKPYPGVVESLQRLVDSGWQLAVVTNKPTPVTRQILDGIDLLPFFGAVVGGGDAEHLKPDPTMLEMAAAHMGQRLTSDDWMVGDNFTDLEAARRAGMRRCFCRYGFGETRGEAYDIAIDTLPEFVAAVAASVK